MGNLCVVMQAVLHIFDNLFYDLMKLTSPLAPLPLGCFINISFQQLEDEKMAAPATAAAIQTSIFELLSN